MIADHAGIYSGMNRLLLPVGSGDGSTVHVCNERRNSVRELLTIVFTSAGGITSAA
jgi:hypothetical protein